MKGDPGLQATRAIREKISREHGNDARRLVEHYMDYQRRFADRLRWAPGTGAEPEETAEDAAVSDAGTQHR
jgi:hypothetical protein